MFYQDFYIWVLYAAHTSVLAILLQGLVYSVC